MSNMRMLTRVALNKHRNKKVNAKKTWNYVDIDEPVSTNTPQPTRDKCKKNIIWEIDEEDEQSDEEYEMKSSRSVKRINHIISSDESEEEDMAVSSRSDATTLNRSMPSESKKQIYNKTEFQVQFPRSNFAEHLIMAQSIDNTLVTDIGNIIYGQGHPLMKPQPLTEKFCDNIMLVTFRDSKSHRDPEYTQKVFLLKNSVTTVTDPIRSLFKETLNLAAFGVKIKNPYLLEESEIARLDDDEYSKKYIHKQVLTALNQETLKRMIKKYPATLVVPIKVSLADVPLTKVIDCLVSMRSQLEGEDYFLMDIDITQDFESIFIKREVEHFLVNEHSFRMQSDDMSYKKDIIDWNNRKWPVTRGADHMSENVDMQDLEEQLDECEIATPIILDDDNEAGLDTLSWLYLNQRVKIYNKFVCQVTNPGVSKNVSNQIVELIAKSSSSSKSTSRLQETMVKGTNKGVTRLEMTIYRPDIERLSAEELLKELNEIFDLHRNIIEDGPFRAVPFSSMWQRICSELKNSCTVIYGDTITHAHWVNMRTRKVTGVSWNLKKIISLNCKRPTISKDFVIKKLRHFALAGLSFDNLPNHLLTVSDVPAADLQDYPHKKNNSYVYIDQSCYFKSESGQRTHFSKDKISFSLTKQAKAAEVEDLNQVDDVNDDHIDFYNAGLVDTPHVKPTVHRTRVNIMSKLSSCGVVENNVFPKFKFIPRNRCINKRNVGSTISSGDLDMNREPTEQDLNDRRAKLQKQFNDRMLVEVEQRIEELLLQKQTEIILKHFASLQANRTRHDGRDHASMNYYADYCVFAFMVRPYDTFNKDYSSDIVLILANKKLSGQSHYDRQEIYYFKGLKKREFVNMATEKPNKGRPVCEYERKGYMRTNQKDTGHPIVYAVGDSPLLTFRTSGSYDFKGYSMPNVEDFKWKNLTNSRSTDNQPATSKMCSNIAVGSAPRKSVPNCVAEIKNKYAIFEKSARIGGPQSDSDNEEEDEDEEQENEEMADFIEDEDDNQEDLEIEKEAKRGTPMIPMDVDVVKRFCKPMDKVAVGRYSVVSLEKHKNREQKSYILRLKALDGVKKGSVLQETYKSNCWFDEEFEQNCVRPKIVDEETTKIQYTKVFDIHVGEYKLNRIKHRRARTVVIAGMTTTFKPKNKRKGKGRGQRRRILPPSDDNETMSDSSS